MDQVSKQGPIFRVFPIPAGPWAGGGKDPSRASHKTFDAYCWERWGFAKPYAVRMIGAAQIAEHLTNGAHGHHSAPALTERLIRPLTRLSAPSDDDKRERVIDMEDVDALKAVPLEKGGRGKKGGLSEYAERVGKHVQAVSLWRQAAEVALAIKPSMQIEGLLDRAQHLAAIHQPAVRGSSRPGKSFLRAGGTGGRGN